MTARRGMAILSAAVATAVAVVLAASAWADPAEQAGQRPRGVVVDCADPGFGGAPGGTFRSSRNLVVGPIAMTGAGLRPVYYPPDIRGQKFPVYMKAGHKVTVAVSRRTPDAALFYGQRRASRVVTFISCGRDEFKRNPYEPHTACCFWFQSGGIASPLPQCVHLFFWVDDEPSPRRAVIHLGVHDCR